MLTGSSYTVACEKGTVSVQRDVVVVRVEGGGERRVEFKGQGGGVGREVMDWGKAVEAGERIQRLSPEEAYKDLVVVSAFVYLLPLFRGIGRHSNYSPFLSSS